MKRETSRIFLILRMVILRMVIIFLFAMVAAGCQPAPLAQPALTAVALPTQSTAQAGAAVTSVTMPLTPTSALAQTAEILTPPSQPETSLEYYIYMEDSASGQVHVKGVLSHYQGKTLKLGRGQAGGGRQVPAMSHFVPEGSTLTKSNRYIEIVTLSAKNQDILTFEYDVNLTIKSLNNGYHWYLNNKSGLVEPEYLLFFPIELSGSSNYLPFQNIKVFLSLPDGLEVLTHWQKEDDHYLAKSTPDLMLGFLGFGKFEKISQDIEGMHVTTAFLNIPKAKQEQLARVVFDLYQYYTKKVGHIVNSTYLPRDQYMVAFVPTLGQELLSNRQMAYGFFNSYQNDDAQLAHRLFHEWNSESGAFYGDLFITEGLVSYYQYQALYKSGLWSKSRYNLGVVQEYNDYQRLYKGTAYDVALDPAQKGVDWNVYYTKGAVVGYMLNETMMKVTDNRIDMDDLMKYLFNHWALKKNETAAWTNYKYHISVNDLLKAVNILTEHDFSEFFQAYVYAVRPSNKPLPVSIQNYRLEVDFNKIPPVPGK